MLFINPRAHAERDQPYQARPASMMVFQPRAHAERTGPRRSIPAATTCFNPRAHAERGQGLCQRTLIRSRCSTHALTRSATPCRRKVACSSERFQPTRSRGSATWGSGSSPNCRWCFNPRAHAERDPGSVVDMATPLTFQPTRSRGARRGGGCARCCPTGVSTHALNAERDG